MATIIIPTFGGEMPRTSPRLLENTQAQAAVNCRLERGALEALPGPKKVAPLAHPAETIFKHITDGWLSWAGVVDVVKSAVTDIFGEKPLGHILITGDRAYPTQYFSGGEIHRLGVPRPEAAPAVTIAAGALLNNVRCYAWAAETEADIPARYGNEDGLAAIQEDSADVEVGADPSEDDDESSSTDSGINRSSAYCYTLVQSLRDGMVQQESAPSPPSEVVDVKDGDGVTLSGFVVPVLEGLTVTHIRIYRTISGLKSSEFHFLVELPAETESWTDTIHDADVSIEVLGTAIWDSIPDDARGLIKTDNGLYAAFRGNELLISEPFIPYAFPEAYRLTVEDQIVALAHVDGTIVVLTAGRPYLAAGSAPESLQLTHLPLEQSCIAARSVASVPGGVVYASPDGLMLFSANDQSLLTAATFTRDQWQSLQPQKILAAVLDGRYICFFAGSNHGFVLSLGAKDVVRLLLPNDWAVHAVYHHSEDDCVYVAVSTVSGAVVCRLEAGEPLPWRWLSKPFFTSALTCPTTVRVEGEQSARTPLHVQLFGPDGKYRRARLCIADARAKRLPPTKAEKIWSLELSGTTAVYEIRLGNSVEGVEYGN